MLKQIRYRQKGFTLIEVLIVIAIIAILGAIAVMTLNPAQASQRARDAQRRKDVATYQTIIEQYITDNRSTFSALVATTSSATNICSGGVLRQSGVQTWNTCAYAATQQLDPINRNNQTVTNGGGVAENNKLLFYEIAVNAAGQYRICTHLESVGNAATLTADGGLYTNAYEIYNSSSAPGCVSINNG